MRNIPYDPMRARSPTHQDAMHNNMEKRPLLDNLTTLPRRAIRTGAILAANTLGLLVARLRSNPLAEKTARLLRNRFPRLWRAAMRIVKPLYLTYQWRKNSRIAQAFSRSVDEFDSEQWKRQQQSRSHSSYPTCSGIENNQPSVDPRELLDRINKNLAAHIR